MSKVKGVGCTSSGIIATAAANTVIKLIVVRTAPSIGIGEICRRTMKDAGPRRQ